MPYPRTKNVYGVGVIHEGDCPLLDESGRPVRLLKIWHNMLKRCYSKGHLEDHPTYVGCSVDSEFLEFQKFAVWARRQIGFDCGWHLDKDIIVRGNKVYSPATCAFVPAALNSLLVFAGAARSDFPIGVCRSGGGGFRAQFSFKNRQTYIGSFKTPELAFEAYKARREAYVKQMAEEYRAVIDPRVYDALMRFEITITD